MGYIERLPIVDISSLNPLNPADDVFDKEIAKDICKEFYDVLSTTGFMYLTGHTIEEEIVSNAFAALKEYFEPKYDNLRSKFYKKDLELCGNVDGNNSKFNEKKALDLNQALDFVLEYEGFKAIPLHIREPLEKLYHKYKKLSDFLLKLLTVSLGMDDMEFFLRSHAYIGNIGKNSTSMRILNYPAVDNFVLEEDQQRISEHTDFGTITMIFQDTVGGLQVLLPDNKTFLDVEPIKNSIVLNVGDLLQLWTNGKLKSTLHRVVMPTDSNGRSKSRSSIAFFTHPDTDVVIETKDKDGTVSYQRVRDHIIRRNSYLTRKK